MYGGGDVLLHGSLDMRLILHPSVALIPFVEAGRVWASLTDRQDSAQAGVRLAELVPVAGVGLELRTAGRVAELFGGVRLVEDTGLPGEIPRFTLQLRLRRDLKR